MALRFFLFRKAADSGAVRAAGIVIRIPSLQGSPISLLIAGGSKMAPPTRKRAKATITVQSSEAKPYDQSGGPELTEIHLNETFRGDMDGESPVRALEIRRDDQSASLVSMQQCSGKLRGGRGRLCCKVRKSSTRARSRRHGWSCRDREPGSLLGYAARAVLQATWKRVGGNAGLLVRAIGVGIPG
jgi:hypothetical protein